jgi:hypothetical protein
MQGALKHVCRLGGQKFHMVLQSSLLHCLWETIHIHSQITEFSTTRYPGNNIALTLYGEEFCVIDASPRPVYHECVHCQICIWPTRARRSALLDSLTEYG